MRKLFLSAIIICLVFARSFGQQDAMYSQYMFNQLLINPAYAGNHEVINSNLLYRHQWVGIDGAPVTETFSVDAPLLKTNVGMGLTIYNDKIGISNKTGYYFTYAYKIKFHRKGVLAFGLQGGGSTIFIDYTKVVYSKSSASSDDAFAQNIKEFEPNFGAGAFYNTNKFYLGLAVPYILRQSILQKNNVQGYVQYQHYFLSTGYVFTVNKKVKIKPSLLIKYVEHTPLEIDVNANVWFFNKFSLGVSYRSGDSFDMFVELQLNNQLRVGYAYDYTTTDLSRFNSGSHELMVKYEMSLKKSRIITPRYF